ncbi:MAG TPA: ATP-dependent Clp protease adaptor ClpS [Pirellulales bacterium]|nr:ATP-dependent Clp protease adaptor ClpS [Pirellulales bacterium]
MAETIAVAEPVRQESPDAARSNPKRLPPYAVVVLNDDEHTFVYVISTFMKVFGYDRTKSFRLALEIHARGRGIVWTGPKEVAELKRDQIHSAGPDLHAAKKVSFPLGVVLEPLPE